MTSPTDVFASVSLFSGLDSARREDLVAASRVRQYRKGQVLCSEGDPGEDLLVLESGRVRISHFAATGQEVVLAQADAPIAFGELALIDGSPRAATLVAETDIRVRYLHRQIVLDLVAREPSVALALMRSLATMVRATNERLSDVLSLDVPGRLAKWLLAHAGDAGCVTIDQSQEELARSIGTTRVTVNRTLHQFLRRGLIDVRDQEIVLHDVPALRSISEG